MKSYWAFVVLLIASLLLFGGCQSFNSEQPQGKNQVTVSILPEKFFVERVAGELVDVNVMVGPGDSPHTYEPKPAQMAALSRSSLYFAIGVEFEGAWMEKIASANPQMKIVDLSEGIDKIPSKEHHDESIAAEDSDDEHSELDPHIWTSPENVKAIAQKIFLEMSEMDPGNKAVYQANLDLFLEDLTQLQKDIRTSLDPIENRRFLVFHPAWGYFAEEFGFEEIAIEIGGTEPSASELAGIIDQAQREKIRVIFAQPEFSTQIAEYIAGEIGGQVVLVSPLAENWLESIRQVADSFLNYL